MNGSQDANQPHRRYNPLLETWVIVSPQRLKRPWQGSTETESSTNVKGAMTSDNPLKPNAQRPSGAINPDYTSTYTFTNDFPALTPDLVSGRLSGARDCIFSRAEPIFGTCRVICFDPRSDVHLVTMTVAQIGQVIEEWRRELADLGSRWKWVQIFENRGEMVGCSNPHPHCQVWACDYVPTLPAVMDKTQRAYFLEHGRQMLLDYAGFEIKEEVRIVCKNQDWLVVVPFWATWPFETLLLPRRRHVDNLLSLTDAEQMSLAAIMKQLLLQYDSLFNCSFPYSMGWLNSPFRAESNEHWQLHAAYLPPLLRSATVKKFQAGFELLCECQRDLTPEIAAEQLRQQSDGQCCYKDSAKC